ncbi:DUF3021 family protein [Bulleidia sp. zg-1006]|uniref:DUF3021 family protein n=1 Tax=Bulleidia sp. zg-1006 TaxID=2806552 RepID=UPI00351BFA56
MFLVGIIVILPATASVIYEIENRSLLKQSIAHFIIMFLTVFPCLLVSDGIALKGDYSFDELKTWLDRNL